MAAREELGRGIANFQDQTITLVTEVGTGHSQNALIGKDIDETEVDDVQRCLVAEMAQS